MRFYKVFDSTANDSDKSWTVPTGKTWEILYAHVILTSTATVGNRQIDLQFQDESNNVIIDIHAGAVQAASNTYHYEYLQGIYRETSFIADSIQIPVPQKNVLLGGWSLRFYDSAAIDAAADDMTVSFIVAERNI